MKFAWCLVFGLLVSSAQAACPIPLQGAQPGWFAETYDKRAPFDDKQGVISPPPIGSMSTPLPISFAQLDPGGTEFPNVAFMARFRVCEAGAYEFYSILQETGSRMAFRCRMTIRVNGSRVGDSYEAVALRDTLTTPSRVSLEPGWAEVRLTMSCGGSSALSFYRKHWRDIYFTARVRGPNDNMQREFAAGEVVNLGRATLSSQAGTSAAPMAAPVSPPPPVAAPASVPEQRDGSRPPRRRPDLQIN